MIKGGKGFNMIPRQAAFNMAFSTHHSMVGVEIEISFDRKLIFTYSLYDDVNKATWHPSDSMSLFNSPVYPQRAVSSAISAT